MIEATGTMTEHPLYGEQLAVESYEIKAPEDTVAMERYLGSGAIKGVGAALAARIVKKFKNDTFRIMEEEPERLSEVKGISEKMAMAIGEQVEHRHPVARSIKRPGSRCADAPVSAGDQHALPVLRRPLHFWVGIFCRGRLLLRPGGGFRLRLRHRFRLWEGWRGSYGAFVGQREYR